MTTKSTARQTISVEEAGKRLGISRNTAYEAAARGDIPTLRIGRRLLVPEVAFARLLDSTASQSRRPEPGA